LLDYFVNMVYGLELLFKVMSRDWDGPGSRFRHDILAMYLEIFRTPYTKSDLLKQLEEAVKDQKYLYEPKNSLQDRVDEIEDLWDELTTKYYSDNFLKTQQVVKDIKLDAKVGKYLATHVDRFFQGEIHAFLQSKETRIAMKKAQGEFLKKEIEKL